MERWYGIIYKKINSMHHQAIDKIASSLKSVAVATDGTIEAVEGIDKILFTVVSSSMVP